MYIDRVSEIQENGIYMNPKVTCKAKYITKATKVKLKCKMKSLHYKLITRVPIL